MELLGYLGTILMGLSLGVLGGGGSILTVPILIYFFKVDALLATSYSLFIVGLSAFVGAALRTRSQEVDFKTGLLFALPSFVGVYITRVYALPNLPENIATFGDKFVFTKATLVMTVFALMMLAASVSMFSSKKTPSPQAFTCPLKKRALLIFQGFFVGAITGFVGVGGGFLIIPALVVLVGLPMKTAIGTSLSIIAANSFVGFIGDLQLQKTIQWPLLIGLSGLSLIGLFFGTKLSHRLPEAQLKKIFALLLVLIGGWILWDQLYLFKS